MWFSALGHTAAQSPVFSVQLPVQTSGVRDGTRMEEPFSLRHACLSRPGCRRRCPPGREAEEELGRLLLQVDKNQDPAVELVAAGLQRVQ